MAVLTDDEIATIKVGDTIRCRPTHLRDGSTIRNRKVRAVVDSPYAWQGCGIAVNAHGYKEYWIKTSEIISITDRAVPSRKEIVEYMELHNADEAGIDNLWDFEDAEYFLLLSDKYHVKSLAN